MKNNNLTIKHNRLEKYLTSIDLNNNISESIANLIFIYGEKFLIRHCLDLVSSIFSDRQENKNCFAFETLEGSTASMGEIIEQVTTFSFFQAGKVIIVKNIPLFRTGSSTDDICFSDSELDHFEGLLEKGIPENHFLILTADLADKRKKLFKTISTKGLIVDCQVPKGQRKTDLDEQKDVLRTVLSKVLSKSGKRIDSQAFETLHEMTGFNIDLFSSNLEKLIDYAGRTDLITADHVNKIISRDREEPVFNFTSSFMEKNLSQTLFYLNTLLDQGYHLLQILKAFENQVRKLILFKAFQTSKKNLPNTRSITFNMFKQTILPDMIEQDRELNQEIETAQRYFSQQDSKKKNKQSDLLLAPNPNNPYPMYKLFLNAGNFSREELNQTLIFLAGIDYKIKSSSFDAKTVIENHIINICSGKLIR